jgi:hypothetical protein
MTHRTMPMELTSSVNVEIIQIHAIALENLQSTRASSQTLVFIIKKIVRYATQLESITIIIMRPQMNILKEFSTVDFQILFSKF